MYKRRNRNPWIILALILSAIVFFDCGPKIKSFTPEEGPIGTEVTIKGSRFKSNPVDNTVTFQGVTVPAADITFASTTMLKVRVPAGAQTGEISVKTSKGKGKSKTNFRVIGPVKWSMMIYMDGDNNLEGAALDDFMEISDEATSAHINVLVQMDRAPGHSAGYGNWTDTRRFQVQAGDEPDDPPVMNLGEVNMGDPNSLRDFVEWGITNYPAERYAVVIWNHGDGWRKTMEKTMKAAEAARSSGMMDTSCIVKSICTDDTDNDVLYMREVQDALTAAKIRLDVKNNTNVKLDIVGFDACLMGMIESAYALRDVANYIVGSEDTEPFDGWPYDRIIQGLVANPSQSPGTLADLIVNSYKASYAGSGGITQAAVRQDKLNNLVYRLNEFVHRANVEWATLKTARMNSKQFHPAWSPSCWGTDLWDFADNVEQNVASVDLKNAAKNLKLAVEDYVVSEEHSADMSGSNGLAIYFPPTQVEFNNDPQHSGYLETNAFMPVDFVKYVQWDNWLQDYYSNIP